MNELVRTIIRLPRTTSSRGREAQILGPNTPTWPKCERERRLESSSEGGDSRGSRFSSANSNFEKFLAHSGSRSRPLWTSAKDRRRAPKANFTIARSHDGRRSSIRRDQHPRDSRQSARDDILLSRFVVACFESLALAKSPSPVYRNRADKSHILPSRRSVRAHVSSRNAPLEGEISLFSRVSSRRRKSVVPAVARRSRDAF